MYKMRPNTGPDGSAMRRFSEFVNYDSDILPVHYCYHNLSKLCIILIGLKTPIVSLYFA